MRLRLAQRISIRAWPQSAMRFALSPRIFSAIQPTGLHETGQWVFLRFGESLHEPPEQGLEQLLELGHRLFVPASP